MCHHTPQQSFNPVLWGGGRGGWYGKQIGKLAVTMEEPRTHLHFRFISGIDLFPMETTHTWSPWQTNPRYSGGAIFTGLQNS